MSDGRADGPRLHDILAGTFAQEDVTTAFALLGDDASMNVATRPPEHDQSP